MRSSLRTLLLPRRLARSRFTLYEVVGLLTVAAISLGVGLSFLHDSQAVSLGIIGVSLFNGILCYLAGLGIGRLSGKQLPDAPPPLLRFSIRDMLWLMMVVGVLVTLQMQRANWRRERAFYHQTVADDAIIRPKLQRFETAHRYQSETIARLALHSENLPVMSDEQIAAFDRWVTAKEWIYNPDAQQFEHLFHSGALVALRGIDWEYVAIELPDLSLNQILSYKHQKRQQWLRDQAPQPQSSP